MQAVMRLAEHVWVLAQGRMIAEGTPAAITRRPAVDRSLSRPRRRRRLLACCMSEALLAAERPARAATAAIEVLRGVDLDVRRGRDRRAAGQQRRRQVDAEQQRLRPATAPFGGTVRFDGKRHHRRALTAHRRGRPDAGAGRPPHLPQPIGAREPRARQLSPRPRARGRTTSSASFAIFPRLKERWTPARRHAVAAASSRCWRSAAA